MSEWSKETGLSSVVTLLRAGSNPAPGKGGDLKLEFDVAQRIACLAHNQKDGGSRPLIEKGGDLKTHFFGPLV